VASPPDDVFSYSLHTLGTCQVLSLHGELDEFAAPELEEQIGSSGGDGPLIVDLSDLSFISSAGLHILLRGRPNQPVIVCPPGNVARVLGIVRADRMALVFDDLDSAHDAVVGTTRPR